uniref:5-demethoxyubiquinone hydroxylase, mitochondrial n=1 Tax=Parastrongyloides trichosuri TaxID=131310 RepID=A0A0N4ZPL5_PARTI
MSLSRKIFIKKNLFSNINLRTFSNDIKHEKKSAFDRKPLTEEERKQLIKKIIRVDHMGELAADRIYAGQYCVLKGSPISSVIEHMWKEEKHHLTTFERIIEKKNMSPSIFAPVFNALAFGLGAGTAMISKEAAMACTIAVEELIVQHYNEQIKELVSDDPALHKDLLKTISKFRDEELEHHDTGIEYDGLKTPGYDILKGVIQGGCKAAIWITEKI